MGLDAACQSIGTVLVVVSAIFWLGAGIQLAAGVGRLKSLAEVDPLGDESLPTLTVVATAKDEAARVERAMRSLLAQDYPGLRVVVADDRSTDGTGLILDRLAAEDRRLAAIHVEDLPAGWLGKCHALALGARDAQSEWLLFTDGDITFAPDAVRRAVSLAIGEGADHLAVGPELLVESLGEAVFVGYFAVMFHLSERPWRASDPRARESIGIGAFNLVRRNAYDRAGGHTRIRYDLLDDLALGSILKRSGARQLFALHGGKLHARWHEGGRGLIRGVEKNAFAALRYRAGLTLLALLGQVVVAAGPVAGLALAGALPKIAALLAWMGVGWVYRVTSRSMPIRPWQALLMPLGALIFCYAILRSMVLTVVRRGVWWRGTFYPLDDLRRARVR